MKTLPQLIYDKMDMDQIERPADNETLEQFAKRVEAEERRGNIGDTLALFVVRELNDPSEDMDELTKRMDRAAEQLLGMAEELDKLANQENDTQERAHAAGP